MAFQSLWSNQFKIYLHVGDSATVVILHILIDLSHVTCKRSPELGHLSLAKNRHNHHNPIHILRKEFTLPPAKRAAKFDIPSA